jgi:hypothetical protein
MQTLSSIRSHNVALSHIKRGPGPPSAGCFFIPSGLSVRETLRVPQCENSQISPKHPGEGARIHV